MSNFTFLAGLAALACFGFVVEDEYILHVMILTFIWCAFVASWDLAMGYAGVLNFAQLAFFAVGGYSAGMISKQLGMEAVFAIPLAVAFTTVVGLLVGAPCLRLRGEYIALFTLAVHLALPTLLQQGRSFGTGGSAGLLGMRPINILGHTLNARDKTEWYFLTLVVCGAVCFAIYHVLLKGRVGRAFIALRDAESSALALGVNDAWFKMLAFGISAAGAGLCGALYTYYIGLISPSVLGTEFFLVAMAMLCIGGLGRYPGVLAGAFIVTIGNELLRSVGQYRLLIVGLVVIFAILMMPSGIVDGYTRGVRKLKTLCSRERERKHAN